jgi:hypothetical protein
VILSEPTFVAIDYLTVKRHAGNIGVVDLGEIE